MPPLTRNFWNQPWASYNTALKECNHCQLTFTLYNCGCVRMTLPHFGNDPLSKSCQIHPPSDYSSKPKPTTRPKIFYKRKNSGCGRVNEKDCKWNAKREEQCSYDPKTRRDCESYVDIYIKCTHVEIGIVRKCQSEEHRRNRGEPLKHMPQIVGGIVDKFCSQECADKQAVLDEEQRILEEKACRRSENEAQARNEEERYSRFDMQYKQNRGTQRPRSDRPTDDSASTSSTSSGSSSYQYYRYTDAQLEEIARHTTRKYRH
ncbi:uncharacterized protein EAE97_000681 [Botrytis byssoidea]|uniref:Uncharacterized protein n=1 Tax=Botrytis byssoidea TaxID=139641 RepID=A0A9P5M6R0_9HELO|nr:uncharacterized protein EAE97_000681 [Botrytis byssoidea]KAF7955422.1 hypothetical protein EAE97_000681 [Botrytis byssoidea]